MSSKKAKKPVQQSEKKAPSSKELSESDLDAVSGGVLISGIGSDKAFFEKTISDKTLPTLDPSLLTLKR